MQEESENPLVGSECLLLGMKMTFKIVPWRGLRYESMTKPSHKHSKATSYSRGTYGFRHALKGLVNMPSKGEGMK